MSIKDIKSEARQKLPLNLHQSIIVYLIEYVIFVTLFVLVLTAGLLCASANYVAAAVIIFIYGIIMLCLACVWSGVIGFGLSDFYIASYRCKPYNIRRLADVVSRNGVGKIVKVNLIRAVLGFLLLICLIVPGLFYLTRTAMANYLLNANPNMKPSTALSASSKVMSSKTGAYMGLMFSMFGWFVIGVITLGIGFIFIMPYINMVKAVYYKRVLAGDKTVYNIPVQPVSPMPEQAQSVQNIRPESRTVGNPQIMTGAEYKQPERPIKIDNPVPPVATLADADIREMNETIRDIGASEPVEVPEVPITPPGGRTVTKSGVASPEPISDSFVEFVKPLTTREVDESRVFDKKVDEMFSGTISHSNEKPIDYMTTPSSQSPNDFITQEVGGKDEAHVEQTSASAAPAEEAGESVMSDAEFAEFIRGFNVPTPESQFTPLKQRKKTISDFSEPEPEVQTEPVAEKVEPTNVEAERPTLTTRTRENTVSSFDRERARREREERLRNLRRK